MVCRPGRGKFAMVDAEDHEWLDAYKWYAYEAYDERAKELFGEFAYLNFGK